MTSVKIVNSSNQIVPKIGIVNNIFRKLNVEIKREKKAF